MDWLVEGQPMREASVEREIGDEERRPMRIFISWSGGRSHHVALALRSWLPLVLHYAEPWISDKDIQAGDRWATEVGKELEGSHFGILVS